MDQDVNKLVVNSNAFANHGIFITIKLVITRVIIKMKDLNILPILSLGFNFILNEDISISFIVMKIAMKAINNDGLIKILIIKHVIKIESYTILE